MAFNFPNSPAEGQTYSPSGGPNYIYLNGGWRVADSVLTQATAERRNRIVNSAMQISQENGNTSGTTTGYYATDQFPMWWVSSGTFTAQRVQSVTPNGSVDRLRVTITVADAALAAGDQLVVQQALEGLRVADFRWGSASARQVILRFGWKSPAGTYSVRVLNGATNRSYVANFTISAGQTNTDTEQTLVIPGDTTGTWATDTSAGMYIAWSISCGSTFQGATGWQAGNFFGTSSNSNGMTTAGNVFELYDVGLYLDPQNTGVAPRWEMPDAPTELAACQRYYWSSLAGIHVTAFPRFGSDQWRYAVPWFPVPMRIAPALTATGLVNYAGGNLAPSGTNGHIQFGEVNWNRGNTTDVITMPTCSANARM